MKPLFLFLFLFGGILNAQNFTNSTSFSSHSPILFPSIKDFTSNTKVLSLLYYAPFFSSNFSFIELKLSKSLSNQRFDILSSYQGFNDLYANNNSIQYTRIFNSNWLVQIKLGLQIISSDQGQTTLKPLYGLQSSYILSPKFELNVSMSEFLFEPSYEKQPPNSRGYYSISLIQSLNEKLLIHYQIYKKSNFPIEGMLALQLQINTKLRSYLGYHIQQGRFDMGLEIYVHKVHFLLSWLSHPNMGFSPYSNLQFQWD